MDRYSPFSRSLAATSLNIKCNPRLDDLLFVYRGYINQRITFANEDVHHSMHILLLNLLVEDVVGGRHDDVLHELLGQLEGGEENIPPYIESFAGALGALPHHNHEGLLRTGHLLHSHQQRDIISHDLH